MTLNLFLFQWSFPDDHHQPRITPPFLSTCSPLSFRCLFLSRVAVIDFAALSERKWGRLQADDGPIRPQRSEITHLDHRRAPDIHLQTFWQPIMYLKWHLPTLLILFSISSTTTVKFMAYSEMLISAYPWTSCWNIHDLGAILKLWCNLLQNNYFNTLLDISVITVLAAPWHQAAAFITSATRRHSRRFDLTFHYHVHRYDQSIVDIWEKMKN